MGKMHRRKNITLTVVVRMTLAEKITNAVGVVKQCWSLNYADTIKWEIKQPELKEPLETSGGTLDVIFRSWETPTETKSLGFSRKNTPFIGGQLNNCLPYSGGHKATLKKPLVVLEENSFQVFGNHY